MYSSYRSIARHLRQTVEELRSIDRDKGQLDDPKKFESLLTPAALLDFSTIQWKAGSKGYQLGTGTMTIRLVFRLPTTTRDGADWVEHEKRERLSDLVYVALDCHESVKDRVSGGDFFTETFHVCEQTFNLVLHQQATIKTIPKPAPDIKGDLTATINLSIQ